MRWTLAQAEVEFGPDPRTLAKRLAAASIPPGEDGMYSTREIVAALHGDAEGARVRLLNAQAERIERENQRSGGLVVPVNWLEEFITEFALHLRSLVWREARIPEPLRRDILNSLAAAAENFLERKLYDDEHTEKTDPDTAPAAEARTRQARRRAGKIPPAQAGGGAGAPPDAATGILRRDAAGGGEAEPA